MELIGHLLIFPSSSNVWKQAVFSHDSVNSLMIYMGSSPIKPQPDSSVTIGTIGFLSVLANELHKAVILRALFSL